MLFRSSILKRMKQLLDMYRFLKLLEKATQGGHSQYNSGDGPKNGTLYLPMATRVIQSYADKYGVRYVDAQDLSRYCLANGYTEALPLPGSIDTGLRTTAKGRKFISRPFGLIDEILSTYSASVQFFTGSAFAAGLYFVWRIVEDLYKLQIHH